jgi:hypothetical protein
MNPPVRAQIHGISLAIVARTASVGGFGHAKWDAVIWGWGGALASATLLCKDRRSPSEVARVHKPGRFSPSSPDRAFLLPEARSWNGCGLYLFHAYVLTAIRGHRSGDANDSCHLPGQGPRGSRDRWRHFHLFSGLPGTGAVTAQALRATGGVATPQGGGPQKARGAAAFQGRLWSRFRVMSNASSSP